MTQFGTSGGVNDGRHARAHDRADEEKTTRDQAERWATLLGAQLASIQPKTSTAEPTSAWHPGGGELTPSADASSAPGRHVGNADRVGFEPADAAENRLIVRVDGGDLGEVALLVDRKDGAIRVTISAADASAQAALGLERASLMRALQSQGISVDSVRVVRASQLGTDIAKSVDDAAEMARAKTMGRSREASEAESKDDEQVRRRLARKLNLVG